MSRRFWRFTWAFSQIFNPSAYRKHRAVLKSPGQFWMALMLKLMPGLYKKPILLRLKNGGQFYVREFMSLYFYNEIFIEKIYDEPALTKSKPCIVDIGGNTGLFSIRMDQLYPDSSIYTFEPFPANYELLKRNIDSSGLTNITAVKKGIGGTSRTEKLFIHPRNIGGHSIIQSEAQSDDFVQIEILGIEEALNGLDKDYFDLIKIDVEGAEYEIIKAITPALASRIGAIVFEGTGFYDVDELTGHLKSVGFDVAYDSKSCNYIASGGRPSSMTIATS